MTLFWIILPVAILLLACLFVAFLCYRMAFYAKPRKKAGDDTIEIPEGLDKIFIMFIIFIVEKISAEDSKWV